MRIQEAIKKKTVVHCATESEANRILKLAHDSGCKWFSGKPSVEFNYWNPHKESTCYQLSTEINYDSYDFFKELGCDIIESTEIESESPEKSEDVDKENIIVKQETILQEADRIVNGERQADYSDPVENFKHIARIASAILQKDLTASDCCTVMIAVKKARESYKHKRDNLVDDAGYTEILYRIKEDEAKNDTI
jgi:hypothetical protein